MMNKDFHEGECEFEFPNGDKYTGQYCAHVSGLAWRQGRGVYVTHDGQIYQSIWKDDKLDETENLKIEYKGGDQYIGKVSKYKYNGPGTYSFVKSGSLTCLFENNKPCGDIIYIDHHNRAWYGKAGHDHAVLNSEHVFSYELDGERGKGRPKYPPLEVAEEVVEPEEIVEELDPKELERRIFAKSTKTPSDLDFENSEWMQNYRQFSDKFKSVLSRISSSGTFGMTDDEKNWYKAYLRSAKLLEDRKLHRLKKVRKDPLKEYFLEELANTCPPTSVFYPTQFEQPEQVDQ